MPGVFKKMGSMEGAPLKGERLVVCVWLVCFKDHFWEVVQKESEGKPACWRGGGFPKFWHLAKHGGCCVFFGRGRGRGGGDSQGCVTREDNLLENIKTSQPGLLPWFGHCFEALTFFPRWSFLRNLVSLFKYSTGHPQIRHVQNPFRAPCPECSPANNTRRYVQ